MINIDCLKPYIEEISNFTKSFLVSEIDRFGFDVVYNNHFESLDATRIINDYRPTQTIGVTYRNTIGILLYLIQEYCFDKEDINNKLNAIINRHKANLEFEKENPPIIYLKKEKSTTSKAKKERTPKEKSDKPKESAKERRLKAQASKLSKLSLKITPVT